MSQASLFTLRGTYSFDVWPANVLGNGFKNVQVLSILDPESARQLQDINAIHAQVYPYLPQGTPNDPTAYDYIKIRTVSGTTTVLGIPWIKENTIASVEFITADVVIRNISTVDVNRIRDALIKNGFNNFEITVR